MKAPLTFVGCLTHLNLKANAYLTRRGSAGLWRGYRQGHFWEVNSAFKERVGTAALENIKSLPYAFHKVLPNEMLGKQIKELGEDALRYFEDVCQTLWLVKDNSVNVSLLYFVLETEPINVGMLNPYYSATKADGGVGEVEINESEFHQLIEYYVQIGEIKQKDFNVSNESIRSPRRRNVQSGSDNTRIADGNIDNVHNLMSRVHKALYSISIARAERYLPAKIAGYVGALECLFSLEPANVTKLVSQRTASYIAVNKEERTEIYNFILEAYDIRSSFVHGRSNDVPTYVAYKPISVTLDEYVRRCMQTALLHDEKKFDASKNEVKKFLKGLEFVELSLKEQWELLQMNS